MCQVRFEKNHRKRIVFLEAWIRLGDSPRLCNKFPSAKVAPCRANWDTSTVAQAEFEPESPGVQSTTLMIIIRGVFRVWMERSKANLLPEEDSSSSQPAADCVWDYRKSRWFPERQTVPPQLLQPIWWKRPRVVRRAGRWGLWKQVNPSLPGFQLWHHPELDATGNFGLLWILSLPWTSVTPHLGCTLPGIFPPVFSACGGPHWWIADSYERECHLGWVGGYPTATLLDPSWCSDPVGLGWDPGVCRLDRCPQWPSHWEFRHGSLKTLQNFFF